MLQSLLGESHRGRSLKRVSVYKHAQLQYTGSLRTCISYCYRSTVMISSFFSPRESHVTTVRVRGGGVKTLQWKPHGGRRELRLNRERERREWVRERECVTWAKETEEEKQNSWKKRSNIPEPEPEAVHNQTPGPQTRTQSSPPCQSPSEEGAPADSSCRTSSGQRETCLTPHSFVLLYLICTCGVESSVCCRCVQQNLSNCCWKTECNWCRHPIIIP